MFTLKVDHLIELQLLQLHNTDEFFHLVNSNREHLRKWLPWVDNITTPYQSQAFITMWLHQFIHHQGINTGIRFHGKLVGGIGFHQTDWYNSQTSIGYYLSKHAQGHGIITKSTIAMVNYAFYELGLHRVEIRCSEHNFKSRAIPEKLGFIKEGMIRDGEKLHDGFHNLVVYGMLSKEWNEKRTYR